MLSRSASKADVLLISMPFAPLREPSIGLSLLKAALRDATTQAGTNTKILYFTLKLAERWGHRFYQWLASGQPTTTCLVGEWIFSSALFPTLEASERSFVEQVLKKGSEEGTVSDDRIEEIRQARNLAPAFLDDCLEEILSHQPKLVGFTSVFQQHLASLALAQRLRQAAPDVRIVFGGANCEGSMGVELLRQFHFIDAVVSGEGEVAFPRVVESVLAGQPIPEIRGVYRQHEFTRLRSATTPPNAESVAHMDLLPYPDYDDFFAQWSETSLGESGEANILFETSRGCWWGAKQHCTFCGLNGTSMHYRSKSGQRAVQELVDLTTRYPSSKVPVVDNILDTSYFRSFLPRLAREKLDVELFYEIKANLTRDQVRLLREAGVTSIQPGIESLSNSVLKRMRKGTRTLQNVQLLKWCQEFDIAPYWNILWGFPGEDPEAYDRMATLIPLLSHLPPPQLETRVRLDRYSPNFLKADELGFTHVRSAPAYSHIYPFPSKVVHNLAYYFEYELADGRDPKAYVEPVLEAAHDWREDHQRSRLFYMERGSSLLIWDFRPSSKRRVTVLQGLEQAFYLASEDVCSLARLRNLAARMTGSKPSVEEIEERLQPLIRDGLMLKDGQAVLSLALPAPPELRRERPKGPQSGTNSIILTDHT